MSDTQDSPTPANTAEAAPQAKPAPAPAPAAEPQPAPAQTAEAPKKKKMSPAVIGCLIVALFTFCCATTAAIYFIFFFDTDTIPDTTQRLFEMDLGTEANAASTEIGTEGGEVTVDDVTSTINGAIIEIAEGALEEAENISITTVSADSVNLPEDIKIIGDVIKLTKTNADEMFDIPVSITIPYDKTATTHGEALGVYEFFPETSQIEATTMLDHDTEAGTIQFLTSHFSYYIILELEKTWDDIMSGDYDTGFRPVSDGWFLDNWGAYITDGGNCFGMSSVAQYVYGNQGTFDKDFYDALIEGDPDKQEDDKIANELAARVQLALENRWNTIAKDTSRFEKYDQPKPSSFHGQAIMMNFMVTGEPQVLYVQTVWKQHYTDGSWEWKDANQHAVMTYKYENGKFAIYDPNFPYRKGKTDWDIEVDYSWENGFGTFGGYNYIRHIGPGLMANRSMIAALIAKAKAGFPDNEFPEITFDAPEEGEVITEKSVVISGTVDGGNYQGQAGEKFMHWYHQNEKGGLEHVRGAVNDDGTFEQELPVVPGDNTINVLLAGADPDDEWAGYDSISFKATVMPADLITTLTWARGQSDIDLHVTDPEGNHVYYSNMTAPTGANLDFDNTSGYGPEHYTISSAEGDRMPEGKYKVEVVYYGDYDENYDADRPIPWTITMRWVKMIIPSTGEKIWESVTKSGTLTSVGQTQHVYDIEFYAPSEEELEIVENPFGI